MELRHVTFDSIHAGCHVRLSGQLMSAREARELELVFYEIAESAKTLNVVTLDSEGSDFCPGIAENWDPLTSGVNPANAIARCSVPVVVALRGQVRSVGLELALAGDLRVADSSARFSLPDVAAGRLPCWGGTQRLPRAAGRSVAARMLLAGIELDAADALSCGLIHELATGDLEAACARLVRRLGDLAPLALAAAKEALSRGPELPMRQALELEGDLNHLLQTSTDRSEGLEAFFAKRPPKFTGS